MTNDIDAIIGVKDEPKVFKASSGIEFKIKPISQHAIAELRNTRKPPVVPTYKVKLAGGDMEEVEFDEAYVKDHADDEDVILKWGAYMMALNEDTNTFVTRFGRMVVSMGTEIDVPDKDSAWQKEQEFIGFVPPAGGPERKIYYMLQSVLTGDTDMNDLSTAVLALGRVDMEKVRLARESFRNDEGKETPEESIEETGSVASEPEL
jgi:hypothetical protein